MDYFSRDLALSSGGKSSIYHVISWLCILTYTPTEDWNVYLKYSHKAELIIGNCQKINVHVVLGRQQESMQRIVMTKVEKDEVDDKLWIKDV